jgi:hypothetical protein
MELRVVVGEENARYGANVHMCRGCEQIVAYCDPEITDAFSYSCLRGPRVMVEYVLVPYLV